MTGTNFCLIWLYLHFVDRSGWAKECQEQVKFIKKRKKTYIGNYLFEAGCKKGSYLDMYL